MHINSQRKKGESSQERKKNWEEKKGKKSSLKIKRGVQKYSFNEMYTE